MHSLLLSALVLAAFAIAPVQPGPTTVPADMPKIPLAGFDRKMLAISDSHVLWYSSELIESTRGNRVAAGWIPGDLP